MTFGNSQDVILENFSFRAIPRRGLPRCVQNDAGTRPESWDAVDDEMSLQLLSWTVRILAIRQHP